MLKRQNVKGSNQVKITFVVPNDAGQGRVYVAGDFNDWKEDENLLVKRSNNTRSVSVVLDPGRYAFRYCTEDGEWFNDEAADDYVQNDLGTEDCVVVV